jgi:hypothetical protein
MFGTPQKKALMGRNNSAMGKAHRKKCKKFKALQGR